MYGLKGGFLIETLFSYFKESWEEKRAPQVLHTRQRWDAKAPEWEHGMEKDTVMKQVTAARIEAAVRFLTSKGCLTGSQDVIDIGCGPGRFVAEFAKTARWVTGTDLSSKMLEFGAAYCQKKGLENVSFVPCDFETVSLEEMGWEKSFDLVFASMTPALSTFSSLEKMIRMSRGFCCDSCCILTRSTMEDELCKALGAETVGPAWDGRLFYTLLNLVWLMGYFPYTDYYPIAYTDRQAVTMEMVREKLQRICKGTELEEWQVEKGYRHLMDLSENGVYEDRCSNWYGAVLWDVRIRTERCEEIQTGRGKAK